MIDKCFKCNGEGYNYTIDIEKSLPRKTGSELYYKSEKCYRCNGVGALNYEIVRAEQLKIPPKKKETKEVNE